MDRRVREYYIVTFPNGSEVFRELTSEQSQKELYGFKAAKIIWHKIANTEYAIVSVNKGNNSMFCGSISLFTNKDFKCKVYDEHMEREFITSKKHFNFKYNQIHDIWEDIALGQKMFRDIWFG